MNNTVRTYFVSQMLCVALVFGYVGGYGMIRAGGRNYGNGVYGVPSFIAARGLPTALYTLYKPLFFLEYRVTGHHFTDGLVWL